MLDATALLKLYARYRLWRLARQDSVEAQRRTLLSLLAKARHTRFGREHGFAAIGDVAAYQKAVPLRRYDDFWAGYWRGAYPVLRDVTWPGTIPFFANSSGTSSGVTKHIPLSRAMVRANRRAAFDLLVHHIANRPQSRILGGRNFILGGSAQLTMLAPGVAGGDLSGIAAAQVPWWARAFYFPQGPVARIADWQQKTEQLAPLSLAANIRSISGTPSWLLLFFEQLRGLFPQSDGRLKDFYPDLELIAHGGVSFAPYRERFAALLQGAHAETREVYPASEGFIAIADRGPQQGLAAILDNGIFLEFVPLEELESAHPTRHWAATVQTGLHYALALTTCAGLWSYVLGDTVRVVDRNPLRLVVTGRTSYSLSAFGEHLIGEQIEMAVAAAAGAIGVDVRDFSVGPVYPAPGATAGYHLYVVEFSGPVSPQQRALFARLLDRQLAARNADYAEHRAGDFGMGPPEVEIAPPGAFAAWMKSRGKLGGQHKVPRVIADPAAFQRMREAVTKKA